MKKISTYLSAFILLFLINGCTEKEYVIVAGPRLQTYEVNTTKLPPLKIRYEVK